ncbi:oxidoreductase AflY [Echria macrotheca]|uniref:Oxidoreductase AflY n=1 Tax=Echria macrotheca TaxID=438768 RepID=A0AAJ0BFC2_9PEZI|nr:oxidoreductase AflY [Echria macrotheca]
MGQQVSRAAFDGLLTKTHVQHALIQPDGRHNDVPTALATLVMLDGTSAQLQAVYESESAGLRAWVPSPTSITDLEARGRLVGDVRFQRAFMTYFSMDSVNRFGGNTRGLVLSHLLTGPKPLIYGLFAGLGRPLVFLSDSMELLNPLMAVQSLTLAAVDWVDPIHELLSHPQLAIPAGEVLAPDQILGRIAYDGRLGGLMKSGPGFHGVSQIFTNSFAKIAVLEYVHRLDCRDPPRLVEQLSQLSVLLVCGVHKPDKPAFDFYLSCVPTWVNSLRVLLPNFDDQNDKVKLIRGVWLLIVLAYITQLRPITDERLLFSEGQPESLSWDNVFADFRRQQDTLQENVKDLQLLRTLRSLWELSKIYDRERVLGLRAAWKLVLHWQGWTGLGAEREETLNIRL